MVQMSRAGIRSPELPNAPVQRRRAIGAPLASRNFWIPLAVSASGVTTRADRCIAWLDVTMPNRA